MILPDFNRIKDRAEVEINKLYQIGGRNSLEHSIHSFLQIWSSTGLGFNRDGMVAGQAFTTKYTTVLKSRVVPELYYINYGSKEYEYIFYTVFFDGRFAYTFYTEGRCESIEKDIMDECVCGLRDYSKYLTGAIDKRECEV